jgi:catechol 2,3-dioxygenase-like lactoylglutathione lyase family enzyme
VRFSRFGDQRDATGERSIVDRNRRGLFTEVRVRSNFDQQRSVGSLVPARDSRIHRNFASERRISRQAACARMATEQPLQEGHQRVPRHIPAAKMLELVVDDELELRRLHRPQKDLSIVPPPARFVVGGANMAQVSIGNHSKIVARPADQERIRAFYRGVLGCTLTKESNDVDYIRFHHGFFVAVLYQDEVPSPEALRQSVWLELRSDEPARLCQQIIEFGVTRIEIPGAEHLYFQAPGGQVFRVVKNGEDLSRFEQ